MEISRRDAEAVTRTAVSYVANRARQKVYNANADIVKKLQYVATLDSRTTLICAWRDGKIYDLGKEPTIPAHFRCRSVLVAYFDNDEEGASASATVQFLPVLHSATFAQVSYSQSLLTKPAEPIL